MDDPQELYKLRVVLPRDVFLQLEQIAENQQLTFQTLLAMALRLACERGLESRVRVARTGKYART